VPYSFATMAVDPRLLAIGVLPHVESRLEDTGLNVLATRGSKAPGFAGGYLLNWGAV
jgi:hypothetical protein